MSMELVLSELHRRKDQSAVKFMILSVIVERAWRMPLKIDVYPH